MHISLSTIAATALIVATAEAAPHGGRHGRPHGRPQGTGAPDAFPTIPSRFFGPGHGFRNHTRGGRGRGRFSTGPFPTGVFPIGSFPPGSFPTGSFPIGSFPTGSFPTGVFPTGAFPTGSFPTGPAFTVVPTISTPPSLPTLSSGAGDVETVSFVFPTGAQNNVNVNANATSTSVPAASSTASITADETSTSAPASSTASGTRVTATTVFPSASGSTVLSTPMTIAAGDSFDGKMLRFDRGTPCGGQSEGGDADAVFLLEEGTTLSNVIIGADQSEGIHCLGSCTLHNVWWEDVCEDALTIKQASGTSFIFGGGARNASDKVIQHNGGGTVHVEGFYVANFGKLYRSCGNCEEQHERHVVVDGVVAESGKSVLVGINSNFGDTMVVKNSCVKGTKTICTEFEGNDTGDEPTKIGSGISKACGYTEADVSAC